MNMGLRLTGAAALVLACSQVSAALNVFACVPEWASLATELGGNKVSVYQASNALQDPHRIEARPSLVARMRSADLAICTGAELEVGWLPVLLQTAGNQKVQPGKPGFIAAAELVERLEIPTRLDRAEGDMTRSASCRAGARATYPNPSRCLTFWKRLPGTLDPPTRRPRALPKTRGRSGL